MYALRDAGLFNNPFLSSNAHFLRTLYKPSSEPNSLFLLGVRLIGAVLALVRFFGDEFQRPLDALVGLVHHAGEMSVLLLH